MQQEMCFSCEVFKLVTQYDTLVYCLEFMECLQCVIFARPPTLSAYNTSLCYGLASYFEATDL